MQQPLQITFRGMDRSEALEARVRDRANELEQICDAITSCRVAVEAPHHHQHKGSIYAVRVDLHVPGKEIIVDREGRNDPAHEDPYVAVRDAFDAAERQLADYTEKRRP